MTFGNFIFPFNYCDNNELININNLDKYIPNEKPNSNLPDHTITEQAIRVCNRNTFEEDNNINFSNLVTCEYYSCEDFDNIISKNNKNIVNIFHNNFNGLETKIDYFRNFLSNITSDFDIITITETSELKNNAKFRTNVDLDGYSQYSMPTNSNKGGVAIYTKNIFDVIERSELDITNDHFEAVWIEIKNKTCNNIIVASIYRHPHDISDIYNNFLEYLERTLSKLTNENKEIYLCGDFNSDILKIDTHNNYKNFYELMSSYGFMPFISLPTRISGESVTIVDNIFTNNMTNKIVSGNIVTDFFDHFSQFISVQRPKIDIKSISIYKRDYSQFSEKSFRDDVSIQNFNHNLMDVNDQFNDFYYKLEGCVNRHAPYKKLTPKEVKLYQKPWISSRLIKMIKT